MIGSGCEVDSDSGEVDVYSVIVGTAVFPTNEPTAAPITNEPTTSPEDASTGGNGAVALSLAAPISIVLLSIFSLFEMD